MIRLPIPSIVDIHADECVALRDVRSAMAKASNATLLTLHHVDERLVAHLDGLTLAGDTGWQRCEAALDEPSSGAVFTAVVQALEERNGERFGRVLALAEAAPETHPGLLSALGWLKREQLQGIVAGLLVSQEPFRLMAGIAACAMHRVDPGAPLANGLHDPRPLVRARALRAAGELGRQDLLRTCTAAIADDDPDCQFWAAWSSVLLGDRNRALQAFTVAAQTPRPHRECAFRLSLQAMRVKAAHQMLRDLAQDPANLRWLIQGSGIAGDSQYVPWLIGHMEKPETARLAGESFSLVTGVDLGTTGLEGPRPENFESGPTDNPEDEDVAMDPDEGLPWPDAARVRAWWEKNAHRYQAGTRYFVGAPVTRSHCIDVLKNGYQRQRILAAHYLCLLEPGTLLFNTGAPAWRQQRLLAKMS